MNVVLDIGSVRCFRDLPPATLALDGACPGAHLDPERQRFSLDHHGPTPRLSMTATCRQVFDALLLGLNPMPLTVLANHLDGDVILSVWILRHHRRWRRRDSRTRLLPLLDSVAGADVHGPAYPAPDPDRLRHFQQRIVTPVRVAMQSGTAPAVALDAGLAALDRWWRRGLVPGNTLESRRAPARARVRNHGHWSMLSTDGGAPDLFARGRLRVVATRPMSPGRHQYLLTRRSDLVSGFPIRRMLAALNRAEAAALGRDLAPSERWGGASTVAGSPRSGSVLTPQMVARIVACTRTPRHRGANDGEASSGRSGGNAARGCVGSAAQSLARTGQS